MKKILLMLAAAMFIAVACDSLGGFGNQTGGGTTENPDDPDDPDNPGGNIDDTTPLTPEENREKLEQIGLKAISMASPDKQVDLLHVIDEFYKLVDQYPFEFIYEMEDPSYRKISPVDPISALLSPVRAFCESGSPYMLSKAVIEDSYFYEAPRAYGIYEFDGTGKEWKRKDSDDRLSFIFPYDGQTVEAVVSASGQEYSYEFDDEYSYSDGYYDGNGNWVSEEEHYIDHITITVPAHIEASVKLGGRDLLAIEVDGEYNVGNGPVKQTFSLTAGSYDVDMNLEITDKNLYLLLPGKISRLAQIYAHEHHITLIEALRRFYRSETYKKLADENTKLWHYGPVALYQEFTAELKSSSLTHDAQR